MMNSHSADDAPQKRLSVIIPGFNTRQEWWRRCVDSVRRACGDNDEIICIDDGSDVPVQSNWIGADVDSRVKLVRKSNGGLSSARNVGLEVIKGKWVAFIDSDDEVKKETFDKCVARLIDTGADIAIYGVEVLWTDERLCKVDVVPDHYYGQLSAHDIMELSKACLLNYTCNKIYKVDFITGIGNVWNKIKFKEEGMPCEDIIFNLECIMAKAKWVSIGYSGYIYYRCGTTLLSSYKPSNDRGQRLCADVWQRYAKTLDGQERKSIEDAFVIGKEDFLRLEWQNIWMPRSPYSFIDRWRWLKKNHVGGAGSYAKMLLRQIARRYLYFVFIRKWRLRKLYPNILPVEETRKERSLR